MLQIKEKEYKSQNLGKICILVNFELEDICSKSISVCFCHDLTTHDVVPSDDIYRRKRDGKGEKLNTKQGVLFVMWHKM